jgi:hypothetical protein
MKEIYHGTTKKNLDVIKPFKRYTPGGEDLADSIPSRIYASYSPAYAVAHSFPWSSDEGIDILVEGDDITVVVPKNKQAVLEQEVCIYTLPDTTFNLTEEEETGLTYHSTEVVRPTKCGCFNNVKIAMKHFGGKIRII